MVDYGLSRLKACGNPDVILEQKIEIATAFGLAMTSHRFDFWVMKVVYKTPCSAKD
jgi:hypothetical protein